MLIPTPRWQKCCRHRHRQDLPAMLGCVTHWMCDTLLPSGVSFFLFQSSQNCVYPIVVQVLSPYASSIAWQVVHYYLPHIHLNKSLLLLNYVWQETITCCCISCESQHQITMFNSTARSLLASSLRAKPVARNPFNCLPSRTVITVKEVKVFFIFPQLVALKYLSGT